MTISNRRWPGVVMSLFVPGFGLFRAGMWRRGLIWMLIYYSVIVAGFLAFTLPGIPALMGLGILLVGVFLWAAMLGDSSRPGRMTWRLWVLFSALIAATVFFPDPRDFCMTFTMRGEAMKPTFSGHDCLVVNRLAYRFSTPKRGDLVVFSGAGISAFDDDLYYVMRLVGLPGERIEIRDNAVYCDDRWLTEEDGIPPFPYFPAPALSHPTISPVLKEGDTFVVGADEYFVLGDNSPHSFDSRYWGGVPAGNIVGKVSKIYYPLNRMGCVNTINRK